MKIAYLFLIIILAACGTTASDKSDLTSESNQIVSGITLQPSVIQEQAITEEAETEELDDPENATYFVVVADTSADYFFLHQKMFDLNRQLNIPIDTMGRFYNKSKNLIQLPDNDEDEMFAGDYFPRRFPSGNLSLEYLALYQRQSGEKTIALVTGIYETEFSADSALTVLKRSEQKIFKVKADMYVGCIH